MLFIAWLNVQITLHNGVTANTSRTDFASVGASCGEGSPIASSFQLRTRLQGAVSSGVVFSRVSLRCEGPGFLAVARQRRGAPPALTNPGSPRSEAGPERAGTGPSAGAMAAVPAGPGPRSPPGACSPAPAAQVPPARARGAGEGGRGELPGS